MLRRSSFVLAALVSALLPTSLLAQRREPGPARISTDSILTVYASRLDLSDEQLADLRAVLEIQAEETRDLVDRARTDGPEAMQDLRSDLTELRLETGLLVEAILTEEQIPEYRKIQQEIQERIRNRGRDRRPPPPPGG